MAAHEITDLACVGFEQHGLDRPDRGGRHRELAEAEPALSDPAQADVPVLTIALDAGFGSIGPFNRAFKAQTGVTPTEYRRMRLGVAPGAEPSPFPN